jgi:dienelactone hydrolase
MKRSLRITAIILGVLVALIIVVVGAFIFIFRQSMFVEKHTPEEIASLLTPHFQIKTPQGKGPFPTVICVPGPMGIYNKDGGKYKFQSDWADYLVTIGYATIFVDSYTGRAFTADDIKLIETFRKFPPSENAGDILVALSEARKLPFVDSDRIALFSWGLGATAIMDLLAMDPPSSLPLNLKHAPDQPLAGLKACIFLSPGCQFSALTRKGSIPNTEILMLLGEQDPFTKACLDTAAILRNNKCPVRTYVYPSAGHVFEMPIEDAKYFSSDTPIYNPDVVADAQERIREFLEEVFNAG